MRFDPADPDELRAGSDRARYVRHVHHPVRTFRERHPTLVRNVFVLVAFAVLCVLSAQRIAQFLA